MRSFSDVDRSINYTGNEKKVNRKVQEEPQTEVAANP